MSGAIPKQTGFTRDDWARAFAPGANRRVLDWIIGWTTHEIAPGEQPGCDGYNLLNTHLGCEQGGGPNAMCCSGDSGHIRRFGSLQEGAQGNRSVLAENHPGYAAINNAINANDINSLLYSSGVRQGLFTWVGFPTYNNLASSFELQGTIHRNDRFTYGSSGGGGGTGPVITTPSKPCDGDGIGSSACEACLVANVLNPEKCFSNGKTSTLSCSQCGAKPDCCAPDACIAGVCVPGGQNWLPGWFLNPDWGRVIKVVVGIGLLGAGILLAEQVIEGKVVSSAPVSTITNVVKGAI